jgi:hypothetical protein
MALRSGELLAELLRSQRKRMLLHMLQAERAPPPCVAAMHQLPPRARALQPSSTPSAALYASTSSSGRW